MLASHWKNGRVYTAVLMYIPAILGCILIETLAFHDKVGLLFSYWLSSAFDLVQMGLVF
jgi:MFS transporter, ACS family, allantoate permease